MGQGEKNQKMECRESFVKVNKDKIHLERF
jgi:hypothetical protein